MLTDLLFYYNAFSVFIKFEKGAILFMAVPNLNQFSHCYKNIGKGKC